MSERPHKIGNDEYQKLSPEQKERLRKFISKIPPYDPRFPNTNQTRNCQQNYLDYFRCLKAKDGDEEYCAWYKNAYNLLCPSSWIEKYDEWREKGIFPYDI